VRSVAHSVVASLCRRHDVSDLNFAVDNDWSLACLASTCIAESFQRRAVWRETLLHAQCANIGQDVLAAGALIEAKARHRNSAADVEVAHKQN